MRSGDRPGTSDSERRSRSTDVVCGDRTARGPGRRFTIFLSLPFGRHHDDEQPLARRLGDVRRRRPRLPARRHLRARARARRGAGRGARRDGGGSSARRSATSCCSAAASRPAPRAWPRSSAGCAPTALRATDRRRRRRRADGRGGRAPDSATPTRHRKRALQLGMTIAAAIGLHNFAEGLAIGVSASTGEIALATVLIIGFGLHNATEGFGIVGPLGSVRPSWTWLVRRRADRRRTGLPRRDRRLQRQLGAARARLLRRLGTARSSTSSARSGTACAATATASSGLWLLSAGFLAGVVTDLVVVYGGG